MNFTGETAISTGAASGMGLLFAQNWVELGGNVVLCDVNEKLLNEKVEEINSKGKGKALGIVCDVRDYAQVCNIRDKAVEVFGSIDVMCNFAGGTAVRMQKVDREKHPEFPDVPIDVYDWGIDVNLKGPFYFAHAVLKQMREQKSGLIINIGSITGQEGDGYGMGLSYIKSGSYVWIDKVYCTIRLEIWHQMRMCFTRTCVDSCDNGKYGDLAWTSSRAAGSYRFDSVYSV